MTTEPVCACCSDLLECFQLHVFTLCVILVSGDNFIDVEEFSYVLSEFECSEKTARQAFLIFTQVRKVGSRGKRGGRDYFPIGKFAFCSATGK